MKKLKVGFKDILVKKKKVIKINVEGKNPNDLLNEFKTLVSELIIRPKIDGAIPNFKLGYWDSDNDEIELDSGDDFKYMLEENSYEIFIELFDHFQDIKWNEQYLQELNKNVSQLSDSQASHVSSFFSPVGSANSSVVVSEDITTSVTRFDSTEKDKNDEKAQTVERKIDGTDTLVRLDSLQSANGDDEVIDGESAAEKTKETDGKNTSTKSSFSQPEHAVVKTQSSEKDIDLCVTQSLENNSTEKDKKYEKAQTVEKKCDMIKDGTDTLVPFSLSGESASMAELSGRDGKKHVPQVFDSESNIPMLFEGNSKVKLLVEEDRNYGKAPTLRRKIPIEEDECRILFVVCTKVLSNNIKIFLTFNSEEHHASCMHVLSTRSYHFYEVEVVCPRESDVGYKFYKPNETLNNEWEVLDTTSYYPLQNRIFHATSREVVIYIVCKFSGNDKNGSDIYGHCKAILHFITLQNLQKEDLVKNLVYFEQHTLLDPRTKCQKAMQLNCSNFYKEFNKQNLHDALVLLLIAPCISTISYSIPNDAVQLVYNQIKELTWPDDKTKTTILNKMVKLAVSSTQDSGEIVILATKLLRNTELDNEGKKALSEQLKHAKITMSKQFIQKYLDQFNKNRTLVSLSIPFYETAAVVELMNNKIITCSEVLEWIDKKSKQFLVSKQKSTDVFWTFLRKNCKEDNIGPLTKILYKYGVFMDAGSTRFKIEDIPHMERYRMSKMRFEVDAGPEVDAEAEVDAKPEVKENIQQGLLIVFKFLKSKDQRQHSELEKVEHILHQLAFSTTIDWWVKIYKEAKSVSVDKTKVEELLRKYFTEYIKYANDDELDKIVKGDYFNVDKVPKELVDILCNELQEYVITSLSDDSKVKSLSKNGGSEGLLKKIMKKKFPNGCKLINFLAPETSTDYFPWVGLFQAEVSNDVVKDAKKLIDGTYKAMKNRSIRFKAIDDAFKGGSFNANFRKILQEVIKDEDKFVQELIDTIKKEYQHFCSSVGYANVLLKEICNYLGVDLKSCTNTDENAEGSEKETDCITMKEFHEEKISNLWHNTTTKPAVVFSKLNDQQIKMLHDVDVCQNKKLYLHKCAELRKIGIKNEDSTADKQTLLKIIVSKVAEPSINNIKEVLAGIINESITQKDLVERIPMARNTENGYADVNKVITDLEIFAKHFYKKTDLETSTVNKVKLVLSRLDGAFSNAEILRKGLNLKKQWGDIEELKDDLAPDKEATKLKELQTCIKADVLLKISNSGDFIEGLENSNELIVWIKEISKNEKDINTFVDLCNTLVDKAATDRLAGLLKLIRALQPLLYKVADDGKFADFQKSYEETDAVLTTDKTNIVQILKDVSKNIEWFKEARQLQTDTLKGAQSQMQQIEEHGVFLVCHEDARHKSHDFFGKICIEDMINVKLDDNRCLKYQELKELNDKLVLIVGQESYKEKVGVFVEVFDGLCEIAELYKELNECGHAEYQSLIRKYRFPKSSDRTQSTNLINNELTEIIKEEIGEMKTNLKEEKEKIEEIVKKNPILTKFTMLQRLYLRCYLPKCADAVDHQVLMMLQSVNSTITKSKITEQVDNLENQGMLTLEELKDCLNSLKEPPKREIPTEDLEQHLNVGHATLLRVKKECIFRSLLGLFLIAKKVPTAEEILCCGEHITEEKIKLFLQQVVLSNFKHDIYCVVCPEKLNYRLNNYFIKEFENTMKNCNGEYYLAIITAEGTSCDISSQYDNETKTPPNFSVKEIKDFVYNSILKHNCHQRVDHEGASGRLVASRTSGNGKTRFAKTLHENNGQYYNYKNVPIHERVCNRDTIVEDCLEKVKDKKTIYCIDFSPAVYENLDMIVFELMVLRKLETRYGRVFRLLKNDYLLIEGLFLDDNFLKRFPIHFASYLPLYECLGPSESLEIYRNQNNSVQQQQQQQQSLLAEEQFKSVTWQRVCQYLLHYHNNNKTMDGFSYNPEKKLSYDNHKTQCIEIILEYMETSSPSWREVANFVNFLNRQFECYELSTFTAYVVRDDLGPLFNTFVVMFMIRMSQEFATQAMTISEGQDVIENHRLEAMWDKTLHPYLFFNKGGDTFTFIGFNINTYGHLLHPVTQQIIQEKFMKQQLFGRLIGQGIMFDENQLQMPPEKLLEKICYVMEIQKEKITVPKDYKLTLDNTIKLLAIHMRLRCHIPVVIMGETGCGKTRLIRFMCDLIKQNYVYGLPDTEKDSVQNLITLRVHGGVTSKEIIGAVEEAEKCSKRNAEINTSIETILFFDEANTTSEIDLIKEIMCNHRLNGRKIRDTLKFIAAVNPYRKHSDEMIKLLNNAGLGYRTKNDEVFDKIGNIPLRELVYRVHPLPPSLRPLIWDFGCMNTKTERVYINLMLKNKLLELSIEGPLNDVLVDIVSGCQDSLRKRSDQCSFVSLRDVNRFIEVFIWFLNLRNTVYDVVEDKERSTDLTKDTWATIHAVGVCYYVRMANRNEFLDSVLEYFREPLGKIQREKFLDVFRQTQEIFFNEMVHRSGVTFPDNIAENEALKENLFMMAVCIELNIPLFVVGHPGSSKSLAKLIINSCMSSHQTNSKLLEKFCKIIMSFFQCSPQSESEALERVFENAETFISEETKITRRVMPVVVLDEVGLAEDSPKMPLKALHSLLEKDASNDRGKIGFIGISNWALDPAKMNRGLYVTRQVPDENELLKTAESICGDVTTSIGEHLKTITKIYQNIYERLSENSSKSYIGLRDFYCLVKHLRYDARNKKDRPETRSMLRNVDVVTGIRANFGAISEEAKKIIQEVLTKYVPRCYIFENKETTMQFIEHNLTRNDLSSGSRYLLVVTPSIQSTIDIIDRKASTIIKNFKDIIPEEGKEFADRSLQIKFNSKFPDDRNYTKVCKAINDVKSWIERGDMIILVNMELIYESLYDVLNQYYKTYLGKKYVEIGLQSHRVFCRVNDYCKIIIIATPEQAEKFPIPLLNRMEKYMYGARENLTKKEIDVVKTLEEWVKQLTTYQGIEATKYDIRKTFLGYHSETIPTIVKSHAEEIGKTPEEKDVLLAKIKSLMLRTVSQDGFFRMSESKHEDYKVEWETYAKNIKVYDTLEDVILEQNNKNILVTTFSDLIIPKNCKCNAVIHNLEEFASQSLFETTISPFFTNDSLLLMILIPVKCLELISYVRYYLQCRDTVRDDQKKKRVILVVQLSRDPDKYVDLYHSEKWESYHLEDLNPHPLFSNLENYHNKSVAQLFEAKNQKEKEEKKLEITKVVKQNTDAILYCIKNPFHHKDNIIERTIVSTTLQKKILELLKSNSNWVKEAAFDDNGLATYQSFQNLLCHKVFEAVKPVVASVFADIDCDGNTKLFCDSEVRNLWECLLEAAPLTKNYNSSDNIFKVSNNFVASYPEAERQFPFSWIIKEKIEAINHRIQWQSKGELELPEEIHCEFVNEFKSSKVEDVLLIMDSDEVIKMRYLSDYVNMVYPSNSMEEMKIARRILYNSISESVDSTTILDFAIWVHMGYKKCCKELSYLEKLFIVIREDKVTKETVDKQLKTLLESNAPLISLANVVCNVIRDTDIMKVNKYSMPINSIIHHTNNGEIHDSWEKLKLRKMFYHFTEGITPPQHRHYKEFSKYLLENSAQGGLVDSFDRIIKIFENIHQESNRAEELEDISKRAVTYLRNVMLKLVIDNNLQNSILDLATFHGAVGENEHLLIRAAPKDKVTALKNLLFTLLVRKPTEKTREIVTDLCSKMGLSAVSMSSGPTQIMEKHGPLPQVIDKEVFCKSFYNTLTPEEQKKYPAVQAYIKHRNVIPLLKELPTFIDFLKTMVNKYSYKMSKKDAREITIAEEIKENKKIQGYFQLYRKVFRVLFKKPTKFDIPEEIRNMDAITDKDPISLILPDLNGDGLSAMHLIEVFIDLHNEIRGVKPTDLRANVYDAFIPIDMTDDLARNYMVYGGRNGSFSYDILESYLVDEVLEVVPRLGDTIAVFESEIIKMTYREDVNWIGLCRQLHSSVTQERIPKDCPLLYHTIQEATFAKQHFTDYIKYLCNGFGQKTLKTFMSKGDNINIPDGLEKRHVLDAWYTAYFYESIHSPQSPFKLVETPKEGLENWLKNMSEKNLFTYLVELHRFIVDWVVYQPRADFKEQKLTKCWDSCLEESVIRPEKLELPNNVFYEDVRSLWLTLKKKYNDIRN